MANEFSGWWLAAWLVATVLCFLLPILPALKELWWPEDATPLKIQPEHTGTVDFRALELRATVSDLQRLSPETQFGELGEDWLRLVVAKPSLETKTQRSVSLAAPVITSLISSGDVNVEGGRIRKLLQARNVYCQAGSKLGLFTSAAEQLQMEAGVAFTKMSAFCIITVIAKEAKQKLWVRDIEVPELTQSHQRHAHAMQVATGARVNGNFVIRGGLSTGDFACIDGHVKVHGPVSLGRGTVITGALFVNGDVECAPDVLIGGALSATGTVRLQTGAQVGSPSSPSSVMAQRVLLGPLIQVFGSVSSLSRGAVL